MVGRPSPVRPPRLPGEGPSACAFFVAARRRSLLGPPVFSANVTEPEPLTQLRAQTFCIRLSGRSHNSFLSHSSSPSSDASKCRRFLRATGRRHRFSIRRLSSGRRVVVCGPKQNRKTLAFIYWEKHLFNRRRPGKTRQPRKQMSSLLFRPVRWESGMRRE